MISKIIIFLLCCLIITTVGLSGGCEQIRTQSVQELFPPEQPLTTRFYDTSGELIAQNYEEIRIQAPLEEVSEKVIKATVATEDQRFYNHMGIDIMGMARAMYHNIRQQEITQGGSTISQQLVKNLFLSPEQTWQRKVEEIILTLELEGMLTKDEILENYLNTVYYGHSAYGIEAAARTYFGKSSSEVNLAEAAMLAGLPRGPLYYSPLLDEETARKRQRYVLRRMVEEEYISQAKKREALEEELQFNSRREGNQSTYFTDYVMNVELAHLWEESPELLQQGGMEIYTTLDPQMQETAEKVLREELPVHRVDEKEVEQPQGALLAVEPGNGYVRALVGGKDYEETSFNRVNSQRSPGSAFKPFVFAAALERGLTPACKAYCGPTSFQEEGMEEPYEPTCFGGGFHHNYLTFREALVNSCNISTLKIHAALEQKPTREMAARLGIQSTLGDYFSLPLGTYEVNLVEMTTAFATFANGGQKVEPITVKKVKHQDGDLLWSNEPSPRQVLDKGVAYLLTHIMQDVLREDGTGRRAADILERPAAGKTGTSQGTKDAYTVGYTPQLVAGVYIGDDMGEPLYASGGELATPIWAKFMDRALADKPAQEFIRPDNIVEATLCEATEMIQGERCQGPGQDELFIKGTEPEEVCSYPKCPRTPEPAPWWQFWRNISEE